MTNKDYPAFSVLMSVYYKEKPEFLEASLFSIKKQTVQPKEIIMVEDGALTENLYSVIDKYSLIFDNRFKIIKLDQNTGLGHALRVGTECVTTEWIARMDTDDIAVPDRFELQLNEILKNPDIAVIGGQIDEFVGTPDNIVGKRNVPLTEKEIYKFAELRNPFNHPTVMINKKKLLEVGGYKTANKLEDYNLWVQFMRNHAHLNNINEVLVHMRSGDSQYRRRGGTKYLISYMKMKNQWRRQGVGNHKTVAISDISMIVNTIMSAKMRKYIYQHILHR